MRTLFATVVATLLLAALVIGARGLVSVEASMPQSMDHRIIRHSEGTYSVQTYYASPGWHDVCSSGGTLEDARRIKQAIEQPDEQVVQ